MKNDEYIIKISIIKKSTMEEKMNVATVLYRMENFSLWIDTVIRPALFLLLEKFGAK